MHQAMKCFCRKLKLPESKKVGKDKNTKEGGGRWEERGGKTEREWR